MKPVLIVDDDPAVRYIFSYILGKAGLAHISAADIEEGLKLAPGASIILLDHCFPRGRSGVDFMKEYKRQGLSAPVVVFTGSDHISGILPNYLMYEEVEDFLTKPMSVDDFAKVIWKIGQIFDGMKTLEAASETIRIFLEKQGKKQQEGGT